MKKKNKNNKYDEMSLDAILNVYTNNGVGTSNDAYYTMDRAEHERAIDAFIESLEHKGK